MCLHAFEQSKVKLEGHAFPKSMARGPHCVQQPPTCARVCSHALQSNTLIKSVFGVPRAPVVMTTRDVSRTCHKWSVPGGYHCPLGYLFVYDNSRSIEHTVKPVHNDSIENLEKYRKS